MTVKDSTTQIRYTGPDVEQVLFENKEIVGMINEWASRLIDTVLHIDTEREEGGSLHWTVDVSSPQGRQSYDIKRYTPKGVIQFSRA